jgi:hypothetical protein
MNSAPIKPLISTSDLGKIDVRIGTISRFEDVAYSETLVTLRVAAQTAATNSAGTASWKRSDIEFTNNDGPPMSNDEWEKEFCTPD